VFRNDKNLATKKHENSQKGELKSRVATTAHSHGCKPMGDDKPRIDKPRSGDRGLWSMCVSIFCRRFAADGVQLIQFPPGLHPGLRAVAATRLWINGNIRTDSLCPESKGTQTDLPSKCLTIRWLLSNPYRVRFICIMLSQSARPCRDSGLWNPTPLA